MSNALPKWDETRVETLKKVVGNTSPVTVTLVNQAAQTLETTPKSVAAKLRKMGYKVESMAKSKVAKYTEAEEAEIRSFLEANPNKYTYAEIAEAVLDGSRTAKQIQGKILSMELYGLVKETPAPEVVKKFTDEEEAKLRGLLGNGKFIEDIAEAMGRDINAVRGKILAMYRSDPSIKMPKQKNKKETPVDPIDALGDSIVDMTVEEISEAISKTTRGVKTMLTRRGISCKNYNGAKKAEHIAAKANAAS
jgi:hypothetical protein